MLQNQTPTLYNELFCGVIILVWLFFQMLL